MPRLRPTPLELTAALAGGVAIGLAYAGGRACRLTRADIARTIAPGHPALGRAAQIGLGMLAALPGTRMATPLRAAAIGAASGVLASRESRAFAASAHALATVVAQRVARR
ncbi:MAG: hypothetical protein QOI71_3014 [Gaiellales bacterium]|jgi:hypothetical protein|nr:hypothetical protein [Gaiellales bacterium]